MAVYGLWQAPWLFAEPRLYGNNAHQAHSLQSDLRLRHLCAGRMRALARPGGPPLNQGVTPIIFLFGFWFRRRFTIRMKTVNSRALLAAYARNTSEAAFRELVDRYIGLVYSTAIRLAGGDSHFAEDVVQTVFIDLARKARGLSSQVMLGGWLHRRTCHVAATMLRTERRRQDRERQAMEMNTQQDNTPGNLAQVAPILDEAINRLNAEDRAAIILRFFEQRDFQAVGEALGSSEDAARMRVSRALSKLHSHLNRRGVTFATGVLGTALATEAATALPPGLASAICTTALNGAALGAGAASTLIRILTMTKMKAFMTGAILLAGGVSLLLQHHAQAKLAMENASLRQQLAEQQAHNARTTEPEPDPDEVQRLRQMQSELPRLRGEVRRLHQQLEAVSAQASQASAATNAVEESAVTNVLSGFTPLQASVHSQVATGQALVVGGWPGHPGERLLVLAVPRITGENADQVAIEFTAMEIPERILADFGLDALRTESTQSALSTVLAVGQLEALHRTLDTMFQELIKNNTVDQAPSRGECLNSLGLGSVTSTNGQPVSLNYCLAAYGDTWYGVSANGIRGVGDTIRAHTSDDTELDLGPDSGPLFTMIPVILSDRHSIDLSLQATIFKRFADSN